MLKLLLPLALFSSLPGPAAGESLAGEFFQRTFLLEATQGSELSSAASSLGTTRYESAYGTPIRLDKWYASRWTDARFSFITQIDPAFGLIWGFSTGEKAAKYRIDPSLKLGFSYLQPLGRQASLSLTASTVLGGRLREKSCLADYGELGGEQEVNCRLAATPLAPADTLNYLVDQRPRNRDQLQLRFTFQF